MGIRGRLVQERKRTPEENLLIAVIDQAFEDYFKPKIRDYRNPKRLTHQKSAEKFFKTNACIFLCSLIGRNGHQLQRRIAELELDLPQAEKILSMNQPEGAINARWGSHE